ncbi:MAG: NFACT RNA binding domain-containing protein [Balneolaceae bacterium]
MNNFYTLIYLTKELNSKFHGAAFQQSYSFQKGIWESVWELPDGKNFRWVYSTRQGETALFPDLARPPARRDKTHFFESLQGQTIEEISLEPGDRFIKVRMSGGEQLLILPFGSRPNIYRVRDNIIVDAFRQSGISIGDPAPAPRPPVEDIRPPSGNTSGKQMILRADPAFPRAVIPQLVEQHNLDDADWEDAVEKVQAWQDQMRWHPVFRQVQSGILTLLSEEHLRTETEYMFDNACDAVRETWIRHQRESAWLTRSRQIENRLRERLSQIQKRLDQLEGRDEALNRANRYEKFGHILTAYAHQSVHSGQSSIDLPDPWNQQEPITIPLPGKGSLADRADHYYRKARSSRRSIKESASIRHESETEEKRLIEAQASFSRVSNLSELRTWEADRKEWIESLFASSKDGGDRNAGRWRRYNVDGWEICVGKNARSNDDLLRSAHKEDLWLHARGSGGSHVVVRMERRTDPPPDLILQHAARFAAWFSKQRHASLVPVIVTRKKYVTKPSGAPPGQVRVQREEVRMVPPQEPTPSHKRKS